MRGNLGEVDGALVLMTMMRVMMVDLTGVQNCIEIEVIVDFGE